MRRLLIPFLFALPLCAQTPVTVTGTITDASNTPATGGYVQFDITPKSGAIHYFISGVAGVDPQTAQCGIDGTGHVKNLAILTNPCTIWGNDVISPGNTLYKVTFAPNGNITNVVNSELITGSIYDLNNPVFAPIVAINPQQNVVRANPFQTNILPSATNTFNIGSPSLQYANGYFSSLSLNGSGIPSFAGNNSFTGINKFKNINNIQFADQQVGGDCGAKILAAAAALAGPGEIWVSQACGLTISTQVTSTLSSGFQTIRFIQDGTWTVSVPAGGAGNTGIYSPNAGAGFNLKGSSRTGTILKFTGGAINGYNVPCTGNIQDITLDGNSAGLIAVASGGSSPAHCKNVLINNVQLQNWTGNALNSGAFDDNWTVSNNWFLNNTGDGAYIGGNATGAMIKGNHAIGNGANGLDVGGCTRCVVVANEANSNGTIGGGCNNIDRMGIWLSSDNSGIGQAIGTIITGNTTNSNYIDGITLQAAPNSNLSNNIVSDNSAQNNGTCGVNGGSGIHLLYNSGAGMTVSSNLIANNTLTANSNFGFQQTTTGSTPASSTNNQVVGSVCAVNSNGCESRDNLAFFANYLVDGVTVPKVSDCHGIGNNGSCPAFTALTATKVIFADVALVAGTSTLGGLPFTNANSFRCGASDGSNANAIKIVYNSGAQVTITGTGTDIAALVCAGN